MFTRIYLISLLFICLSYIGFAQNTVGLISFDIESVSDGYNLIYPNNQADTYLLNNCGEIVNVWEDNGNFRPGNSAYLLENGNLLKTKRNINTNQTSFAAPGGGEIVEVRDWDNRLLSSFELNNNQQRIHHDIEPLPNGNVLMITWELLTSAQAIQAGRDPRVIPGNEVWSDAVLELNPETGEIVWEWHAWNHFVQDFDSSQDNFGDVSNSPGKIDMNFVQNRASPDWLHFNAMDYNPVLDQILISSPYFDEIWIIDHSTTTAEAATDFGGNSGQGGQIIFRWGNPEAHGQPGRQQLFFQHNPNWADLNAEEGDENFARLILYNNRVTASSSAVTILDPVFDTSTNRYALDGNIYLPNAPSRSVGLQGIATSNVISSAQVLANNNLLIMSGRFGYTFELDQDDNIVWEYIIPIRNGNPVDQGTRLSQNDNFTFRFERYDADYPAFIGRDLSAQGFIEDRPNEDFCTLLTSTDELLEENLAFLDHNLITNQLTVFNALQLPYQIISANGTVVQQGTIQTDMEQLDVQFFQNGIYYLRVDRQRAIAFAKF